MTHEKAGRNKYDVWTFKVRARCHNIGTEANPERMLLSMPPIHDECRRRLVKWILM
jgi:hypothetical protein